VQCISRGCTYLSLLSISSREGTSRPCASRKSSTFHSSNALARGLIFSCLDLKRRACIYRHGEEPLLPCACNTYKPPRTFSTKIPSAVRGTSDSLVSGVAHVRAHSKLGVLSLSASCPRIKMLRPFGADNQMVHTIDSRAHTLTLCDLARSR
jgi:hypothetical protein